jgi:hypothetical protein
LSSAAPYADDEAANRPAAFTPTFGRDRAVNPTVDNESRAAGALLITFGLAYIWAMRRSPIPSALLRVLAMTMALIAVARVISMIQTGLPHWIFTVFTVIESIAAALTYWYSTLRLSHLGPVMLM